MIINKSNINDYIRGNRLSCCDDGITSIDDIPDHITHIACWDNKLTSLPKLPSGLVYLNCADNCLTSLPMLPDSLVELHCDNNRLSSYPIHSEDRQWRIDHAKEVKLKNRIEIINKINEIR